MEGTSPTKIPPLHSPVRSSEGAPSTGSADLLISIREGEIAPFDVVTALLSPDPKQAIVGYLRGQLHLGERITIDQERLERFAENLVGQLSEAFDDFEELTLEERATMNEVICLHLANRLRYFCEISENLASDLEAADFQQKFGFSGVQVAHISVNLVSLFADPHHGNKSPVELRIVVMEEESSREVKLVYKPRTMALEAALCDNEHGVIARYECAQKERSLGNATARIFELGTYPVLARSGPSFSYGYAGFVTGEPVCDEEAPILAGNIDENWRIIERTPPATKSFFSTCTPEELDEHYVLFSLFKDVAIADTHAGNFILAPPGPTGRRHLVLIDVECFDDRQLAIPDTQLPAIGSALRASFQRLEGEEDLERVKAHLSNLRNERESWAGLIEEFEARDKTLNFIRVVPLQTSLLYKMRAAHLRAHVLGGPAAEYLMYRKLLIAALNERGFKLDNLDSFDEKLKQVFDRFDIPYFAKKDDIVYLGYDRIGEKKQ